MPLLPSELLPWYRLVDPPADHADKVAAYREAIERTASPSPETLLEMGAGAGHNAFLLKNRFRCTLTDVSRGIQEMSLELNPECEHVTGDMRTLRLGRTFDAVLVHGAVAYMTTEADLLAAAQTAFAHTRPGGAAVFAPDGLRDTFREHSVLLEGEADTRALRGVAWSWDPDPADDQIVVEYALLLRDGTKVHGVRDRHVEGLFTHDTWVRLLQQAGYEVDTLERPLDEDEATDDAPDEVFICRRP